MACECAFVCACVHVRMYVIWNFNLFENSFRIRAPFRVDGLCLSHVEIWFITSLNFDHI